MRGMPKVTKTPPEMVAAFDAARLEHPGAAFEVTPGRPMREYVEVPARRAR
ncbi:MAG TPA: hypothetical protein VFC31_16160 [Candidatus Limnocylindria bacterium]|nr:hypothetical protein [Candidatus Limnocylindria bacterium]